MKLNDIEKKLEAIYAKIPKLPCLRKCTGACGIIPLHKVELERILRYSKMRRDCVPVTPFPGQKNVLLMANKDGMCPFLNYNGCTVYEVRPTMCRLWGVVDNRLMQCKFGCVPEHFMTDQESRSVLKQVEALCDKALIRTGKKR
jgi:Fe-S-cluster containining protein